eukprot:TRINITY_DN2252_c0_g2_i1.p1 TRINITY_DN2252_c0_g2~~TRINITY_DN2252_c0_g2_i1.p1  ORF type:complete len:324 (-),score=54.98 TRINITY_DN2252_c0_g2_i1:443-1414(-)
MFKQIQNSKYPVSVLVVLCFVSYLVGRWSSVAVQQEQTVEVVGRRTQQVLPNALQEFVDPENPTRPGPSEFGAIVEQSGLPQIKPPVGTGETGVDYYNMIPFQVLSWYPRVILYPNFLDAERCDHIIKTAQQRLAPSGVAWRKGEKPLSNQQIRTSQGCFVSRRDDPDGVLAWVEERISQITMVPVGHGEAFNVLKYELDQKYSAHYDTFDPEMYGPQDSQRIATVLLYLSDVEEGGETIFPLEGYQGMGRLNGIDYEKCDSGLKYKPRKGDAVLFWSMHPNGTFDRHALHGGCPVKKGTKWVATKWIRDKCFGNDKDCVIKS